MGVWGGGWVSGCVGGGVGGCVGGWVGGWVGACVAFPQRKVTILSFHERSLLSVWSES